MAWPSATRGKFPARFSDDEKREITSLIRSDAYHQSVRGIGTLEEVIEIFTWLQLGLHLKPIGLLNACGFYDLLLQFLSHMRDEQFLTSKHLSMLSVSADVESLLDDLMSDR